MQREPLKSRVFFDKEGKPIDLERYIELELQEGYRVIGQDHIGESYVSTVWLGINHEFDPKAAPLIFETMVFDGPLDGEQVRYTDEEAAQHGHAAMVLAVRALS